MAGTDAADKLAKFEAKLESWVAGKMSQYDEDVSIRQKQDVKYGDRGGYEGSLWSVVEEKMLVAQAKAAATKETAAAGLATAVRSFACAHV